jgi:hypothetical protein
MTFSLDRLTTMFVALLGHRRPERKTISRLNLAALSERELADLNLPPEVRGRLLGSRETLRIRRGN